VPWGHPPRIVFSEGILLRIGEVSIALTAAHELAHTGQRYWPEVQRALRNGSYELIREVLEKDAEDYAYRMVDRTVTEYCAQ
jgi:hypothetical protein